MNIDELYPIQEVAKKLKVQDKTVRGYINAGLLAAIRMGSQKRPDIRIEESAI